MELDVNIDEILSEDTTQRSEATQNEDFDIETSSSDLGGNDFQLSDEPEIKPEKELADPYDAKSEAAKLVALISSLNNVTLTPLAIWKVKHKKGGKKEIEKMQIVKAKEYQGKKLTEDEKRMVDNYNAYLQDKKELQNAIPYTEAETKLLNEMDIPYCASTKMKINGGMTFWTALGAIQFTRVIQILQA